MVHVIRRTAKALLVASPIGWCTLITVDMTLILSGRNVAAHPIHSVAIGALITSTVCCAVFVGVVVLAGQVREAGQLEGFEVGLRAGGQGIVRSVPRPRGVRDSQATHDLPRQ